MPLLTKKLRKERKREMCREQFDFSSCHGKIKILMIDSIYSSNFISSSYAGISFMLYININ